MLKSISVDKDVRFDMDRNNLWMTSNDKHVSVIGNLMENQQRNKRVKDIIHLINNYVQDTDEWMYTITSNMNNATIDQWSYKHANSDEEGMFHSVHFEILLCTFM